MSIEFLPVELVSKVCSHLNFQQKIALRLSCRALYENSLEHFARTHYQRILFILTSESLHELEDLTKSKGLREYVQELWMIPTVFEGTEKSCAWAQYLYHRKLSTSESGPSAPKGSA